MGEYGLDMKEINLLTLCRKILYGLMKLKWGDGDPPSGDGILRVTFPEYIEARSGDPVYAIELFTCSLGNHHVYVWEANSLSGALSACKEQLESWVQES